jgi:anti-sigma B factor antagonist
VSRFSFETVVRGALAIVTLRGELDLPATSALEPELERLAGEPGVDVVALDLRALEFLDSSGLRAVVLASRQLSEHERRLVLVRGSPTVQRVFEITRMTERLEFVDAPERAMS